MKRLVSVFTCVTEDFCLTFIDKTKFDGYTDNQKSSCELYFYSLRLFFCSNRKGRPFAAAAYVNGQETEGSIVYALV